MTIQIGITGDWRRAGRILGTGPRVIRLALDVAVQQEAQFFRRKVVEGFREQAPGGQRFKPLSETTLAIRRFTGFQGTKILIVRGDLRNSIKVVVRRGPLGSEAFIGVLRSARSRDGKDLVNIARVHEFGSNTFLIEVTPAMRRFLAAAFTQELGGLSGGAGGLSRGVIVVKIPARPFLQPVIDAFFSGPVAAARFQTRVAVAMAGMFGGTGTPGGGGAGGIFSSFGAALRRARGGPGRDPTTGRFLRRE